MRRWGLFAFAYAVVAAGTLIAARWWLSAWPLSHPDPWLALESVARHLYSAALGLAFGSLVVLATRFSVRRFQSVRRLHMELRPFARGVSTTGILVLALASSIGEELLFRGLLQPKLGLLPHALFLGFLHQIPGGSRWVWVGWATTIGLAFGVMFQLTGSLLGCVLAHTLVNGLNLSYLKNHDPEPPRRSLGGLLGQRGT
jgi:membrane protease YdiL (CAAX protease family)